MCGSLLSKFKKNSNKVAPVLGAKYLETNRISTNTNETASVDENMSLHEITVGRKGRTTVRFPDIAKFIEVKHFRDTKESKEENTPSTSDESSRLEPVFGSDAEYKSNTEAQSMENAIITATVERIDDNIPPAIEGRKMTTMDLEINNEKMVASQSDTHFSSKAKLSNEIMITTVNKGSLTSVQSGRFSSCTVQQSSENVLEATNKQTLAPIDDNEKTSTKPHDDPQETAFVFKAPTADRKENATAKKNKLSTCGENYKIDIVSVSDAECQSKAKAMSKEITVTTLTSVSPSTEKHHEEKIAVVVNDPRSGSKVSLSDEITQGSHVAVQNGQCSDFRVLQTTETVLEAVDCQALAPIDKDEEKLTAAHDDSQEIAVVSKPRFAAIKENITVRENKVSTSNENNKLEDVSASDAKCESRAEVQSMKEGLAKVERQDGLDQSHSQIKVAWNTENHQEKMAAIYIDTHSNQASKNSLAAAHSRPFSDCTVQQPTESKIAVEDQRTITFIDKHEETLTVINGDLQESHIISNPLSADGHGLTEIKQSKDKMNAFSGSPSFIFSAKRSAETMLSVPQTLATIDASEEELTVVEVGSSSIHVEETLVTPKPSLALQENISRTHDDSASQSTAHSPDNSYQLINREVLFAKATKELEAKIFRMTLGRSTKDRKLLLAVAKKELEKKIIQMTGVQDGVTSIGTTHSSAYPKRKSIRPKNKKTSLAIAKKQFADTMKEKIAALQSGQSSSNTVRSILLGKTKNTTCIAFEVLDGNKRKQTVIPSARLPLHLRKLDDPPPLPLTAEVFNAKLFRAQENRLRELEQVRSRARYMAWSPKKTYRQ